MKKALITGITGQDGSYLAELLLSKGYEVHGMIRRASTFNTSRIDHLYKDPHHKDVRLFLHYGDLTDSSNLNRMIEKINPCEIYNLGAQSHVQVSFEVPEYSADADALGVLRILDAIKETGVNARFYQASTSELFGKVQEVPQSETTPFYPRSPLRRRQAVWLLDHKELPGSLWTPCLERYSFQPRVPTARRNLCHTQNHDGSRPHSPWLAGLLLYG